MANVVVNSNSQFYKTFCLYRNYVGYTKPLTYRQWIRLDDRLKAGALFCQFYNEITLAWYKVYTKWSIEEEGVECINQYLEKNVEKIKQSKKKFDARYIYKVAYNCLYCVCIDPSKNKDRYYSETSETFSSGEDEVSWFDLLGSSNTIDEDSLSTWLQATMEFLDPKAEIVLSYIAGELTEYQACSKLKRQGLLTGSLRNKEYCSLALAVIVDEVLDLWRSDLHFKSFHS